MKSLGIIVTRIQSINKEEMGKKMVKIRKTIQSISRYLYNALQMQTQILVHITSNSYAAELQKKTTFF